MNYQAPDPAAKKSPRYTTQWHPSLRMWCVCENDLPLGFFPDQAPAVFFAKAGNILRAILSGDFFGQMIIVRTSPHHVSTRSLN